MKTTYSFIAVVMLASASFGVHAGTEEIVDLPSNRVERSGWINVDESHRLSGSRLTPERLNSRVVVVHRWCKVCPKKIETGVKEFQNLSKRYAQLPFVFLTSYSPDAPHSRRSVEEALDRFGVTTPVYVGAAAAGVSVARKHRALYVVAGGLDERWSVRNDNTDIAALAKFLNAHRDDLLETSLRLAADNEPGRALVEMKRLKTLSPKKAAELKSLVAPLDTPMNRRMAEFEEKTASLMAKPQPDLKAAKALLSKLSDFAESAPDALKAEIAGLADDLQSLVR